MTAILPRFCVVALLAAVSACSTDPVEKTKRHVAHAVVVLQRENDADALAAAALLTNSFMYGNNPEHGSSLMARATAAAPDRADLAWLRASICHQPACDPQPLEFTLRSLDPSNGAGWLGEVDRAWTAKDEKATNQGLAEIGLTDRVDMYYTGLIARLTPKVAKAGSISLDEASVAVIGGLAGISIASYASVSRACKGDRLSDPKVVKLCQPVARAFENGDTFISEMIGVAIAKRVWPEDSEQWKAASDARRVYEYRSKLIGEIVPPANDTQAVRYFELCRQYRREQDVFRAQIVEAGQNPDPPAP